MPLPPHPAATLPPRQLVAWLGGIVAAAGAASLTFFLEPFPLSGKVALIGSQGPLITLPALLSFGIALLVGLTAAGIGATIIPGRRVGILLVVAAGLTLSQAVVLTLYGWRWDPLPALLALAAGATAALLLRPASSGPGFLFRNRLSPAALTTLEKAQDISFLRPDQREATVLTCRLLNENALREQLPARDFLKLCETFRTQASALLLQHGACLDPAEPNGVRAFFGLPLAMASCADAAVGAALALDEAVRAWAVTLPTGMAEAPRGGIGLATGTLTAGVTDATYTVLGDAVELSRWLALQNTGYQTRLLLDAATHLAADTVEDRPLEFINPPEGAAVEIFQLLGSGTSLSREAQSRNLAFRDAITLLRAGHAGDAVQRFNAARPAPPVTDPVLEYFVRMAEDQALRDAASHGPPPPAPALVPAPRRPAKPGRKLPRRP